VKVVVMEVVMEVVMMDQVDQVMMLNKILEVVNMMVRLARILVHILIRGDDSIHTL
jgi:hypothetical protein